VPGGQRRKCAGLIEVTPFFAVPFGFAKLESCTILNGELRALFLRRAAEGSCYANPRPLTHRNRQVFESEFQVFRWPEPCVQSLKQFCWNHMLQMIGALNDYDGAVLERMLIYCDSWFHITRRGGFFALHNHPNASWSGVYCVDPGQHDPDSQESGLLSFVNPALVSAMHMDAAMANLKGPFAPSIRHVQLKAGQLVLFPSWILHDVKPFQGEGERITVAFNCWFESQQPAG
jgi:uncharacterized protein (TIGR02466 family)